MTICQRLQNGPSFNVIYQLVGHIDYNDQSNIGHYVAAVKHMSQNKWWLANADTKELLKKKDRCIDDDYQPRIYLFEAIANDNDNNTNSVNIEFDLECEIASPHVILPDLKIVPLQEYKPLDINNNDNNNKYIGKKRKRDNNTNNDNNNCSNKRLKKTSLNNVSIKNDKLNHKNNDNDNTNCSNKQTQNDNNNKNNNGSNKQSKNKSLKTVSIKNDKLNKPQPHDNILYHTCTPSQTISLLQNETGVLLIKLNKPATTEHVVEFSAYDIVDVDDLVLHMYPNAFQYINRVRDRIKDEAMWIRAAEIYKNNNKNLENAKQIYDNLVAKLQQIANVSDDDIHCKRVQKNLFEHHEIFNDITAASGFTSKRKKTTINSLAVRLTRTKSYEKLSSPYKYKDDKWFKEYKSVFDFHTVYQEFKPFKKGDSNTYYCYVEGIYDKLCTNTKYTLRLYEANQNFSVKLGSVIIHDTTIGGNNDDEDDDINLNDINFNDNNEEYDEDDDINLNDINFNDKNIPQTQMHDNNNKNIQQIFEDIDTYTKKYDNIDVIKIQEKDEIMQEINNQPNQK